MDRMQIYRYIVDSLWFTWLIKQIIWSIFNQQPHRRKEREKCWLSEHRARDCCWYERVRRDTGALSKNTSIRRMSQSQNHHLQPLFISTDPYCPPAEDVHLNTLTSLSRTHTFIYSHPLSVSLIRHNGQLGSRSRLREWEISNERERERETETEREIKNKTEWQRKAPGQQI